MKYIFLIWFFLFSYLGSCANSCNANFFNEEKTHVCTCVGQFTLQGGAPVLLSYIANNQVNEIIVPAFIAGQTMLIKKTESLFDFLSQSIGMLMPELLIKPATLNSWSKYLKNSDVVKIVGSRLIKNIDDFKSAIVKGKMSAPNAGYFASTIECEVNYYYHIAENQSSTYKTGWYIEEQYCKEVIKPLLEAFGILAGHITVASINIATERINATSYRIEQFFNSKSVSEDILKTFVTSYYQEICKDASKRLGSSGSIEESNLLFDIVLAFTGFTETKALFQHAGGKLFATAPKLFASKTGKGIELLSKVGGEKIATYTDDVLMEIKYIETGGEVLGNTAKIKVLEDGKPIETVLQIIKKEGQLGFRKVASSIKTGKVWDDIVGTQSLYDANSLIYKSFNLKAGYNTF